MAAGAAIWEWPRPAHLSAAAGIKRFAVAYAAGHKSCRVSSLIRGLGFRASALGFKDISCITRDMYIVL